MNQMPGPAVLEAIGKFGWLVDRPERGRPTGRQPGALRRKG
jgi:hypothetical protein